MSKYSKVKPDNYVKINRAAHEIVAKLKSDKKIDVLTRKEVFVSIKDHKKNFMSNPKCRLINQAKSELGKVSKIILDNINEKIGSNR